MEKRHDSERFLHGLPADEHSRVQQVTRRTTRAELDGLGFVREEADRYDAGGRDAHPDEIPQAADDGTLRAWQQRLDEAEIAVEVRACDWLNAQTPADIRKADVARDRISDARDRLADVSDRQAAERDLRGLARDAGASTRDRRAGLRADDNDPGFADRYLAGVDRDLAAGDRAAAAADRRAAKVSRDRAAEARRRTAAARRGAAAPDTGDDSPGTSSINGPDEA